MSGIERKGSMRVIASLPAALSAGDMERARAVSERERKDRAVPFRKQQSGSNIDDSLFGTVEEQSMK